MPRPSRVARLCASILLRGEAGEVIGGDLDQEFAEHLAAGVPPRDARRRYWRQMLASVAAVRRDARERRQRGRMDIRHAFLGVSLDVRSVLRVLGRSPGYAAIAVISLAIGIGANTAMFSVVRQLLLMPLPVERPDDLRLVYWTTRSDAPVPVMNIGSTGYRDAAGTSYRSNVTGRQFEAMRAAVEHTADLAGYNFLRRLTASAEGRAPIVASGMLASGNFFSTVRPPMALGRGLNDADDSDAAPPVAVIGYGLWTTLFGNDPDVVGRTLRVNDAPVQIVGVTAAAYRGLSQGGFLPAIDVTLPVAVQPLVSPEWTNSPGTRLFDEPRVHWIRLIARVDGQKDEAIRDALDATLRARLADAGIAAEVARSAIVGIFPAPRGVDSLRTSTQLPLRILATVAGVVLLIACINVAGLMLARGVARQKELAVRRALGASRLRIVRVLLLESVLLSVTGGLAGLLVAVWIAPALQSLLSSGLGTSGVTVVLDWPLIGATAALACTAGVLAGLLPALRFSRNADALLRDRNGAAGAPRLLIGRALLVLQIAVSLPLVAGAGLFLRTLDNLARVDLGFNPRGVVLFTADPTMNGRAPERTALIFPRLLERLETIPGVTAATLLENALVSGWESDSTVKVEGREVHIYMNRVAPHYFETMGVPLIAGRPLLPSDTAGVPPVVVINETAARRFFTNGPALGGRIRNGARDLEVVGIAADTKYDGLRNAVEPTMLGSYLQSTMGAMTVAIRSTQSLGALRPAIDAAAHDVDPAMALTEYRTQEEQIDQTIGKERVFTSLLTVFGGFALLLACVGLHGVTSYSVERRTSEIGIRIALGAQRAGVLWLILRQVLGLAAAGLAMGVPLSWMAGPVAAGFLFGLEPRDPVTLAGAAGVMIVVAVSAGLRPARRAAKMEALLALRTE